MEIENQEYWLNLIDTDDTERYRKLNLPGNDSKHRRQCRSTLFPKAENFRSTIIDSGTTSQSQNILITCKLYHFMCCAWWFPHLWLSWTYFGTQPYRAIRNGIEDGRPHTEPYEYMRMCDSKKVGIMGIIQPKMLFSRIRISQASGLDSCLDSHSWLPVVSLDLYLLCHRLFATPTKAVGANQARSWDENSVNGISKISMFGLRLLSGWFCQDCAGMCLTQTVSRISRRAAGKSLSTLEKKLRAYQKLGCQTTSLQWPVREWLFLLSDPSSTLVVGCWPFVTGMRRWTSMEWRWTGPLGLISTGKAEALSAGAIPFRPTQTRRIGVWRVAHHPPAARMMAPEPVQCLERVGWCTRIQQKKQLLWPKTSLAVEMGIGYESVWNALKRNALDCGGCHFRHASGSCRQVPSQRGGYSQKKSQTNTTVDPCGPYSRIGNLRMFSHCAGVAPADCPEYSKRPEHNPLVRSLDCCSKFRSLMTVASGGFDRNIAHVFNQYAVFDTCGAYHDTSSKKESKETRHGEWLTRAPSRDR